MQCSIYLYVCEKACSSFIEAAHKKHFSPDFHLVLCVCLEFEEPRVIDLWDMAKSANFTEKELESFRVSRIPVRSLMERYSTR